MLHWFSFDLSFFFLAVVNNKATIWFDNYFKVNFPQKYEYLSSLFIVACTDSFINISKRLNFAALQANKILSRWKTQTVAMGEKRYGTATTHGPLDRCLGSLLPVEEEIQWEFKRGVTGSGEGGWTKKKRAGKMATITPFYSLAFCSSNSSRFTVSNLRHFHFPFQEWIRIHLIL